MKNRKKISFTKRIRLISLLLLYSGFISIFSTLIYYPGPVSELIIYIHIFLGIALTGVSLILSFLFWRCKYCGKGFELRHGSMDRMLYCPYCNKEI